MMKWLKHLMVTLGRFGFAPAEKPLIFTLSFRTRFTGYKRMAKYFSDAEVYKLDPILIAMLDGLRERAGIPVIITCGFRSPAENVAVGGVENSAHTRGLAADIRCADSKTRYILIVGALAAGFKRIEVADRHLHLDVDPDKPQNVIFLGKSK